MDWGKLKENSTSRARSYVACYAPYTRSNSVTRIPLISMPSRLASVITTLLKSTLWNVAPANETSENDEPARLTSVKLESFRLTSLKLASVNETRSEERRVGKEC